MSWIHRPRPNYTADDVATVIDADTYDWHYNKHHAGYVAALNTIENEVPNANLAAANGNYSVIGELKRRQTWNHAGTLLHDVYWHVMGGDGTTDPATHAITARIEQDFGSFQAWRDEFVAVSKSAKLSGWGVLAYDWMYSGKLHNILVDEHHYGAMWGGIPLIACDVFEHAYYHKDGWNRPQYIENFLSNLHWNRINELYVNNVQSLAPFKF